MSAAKVTIKEIDLSTRVASFEGVYAGIVLPAKKGPVKPAFVTSDTQLLKTFTPNERVEVGYDLGYFSALSYLERANRLWVKRVINGALFGGLVVKASTSAGANAALSSGLADPTSYVFDSVPDTAAIAEVRTLTFASVGSFFDVSGAAKSFRISDETGVVHYFYFVVTDGSNSQTDPAFVSQTGHAVNILSADTAAQIAGKAKLIIDALAKFIATVVGAVVTATNAVAGLCNDAVDVDSGVTILTTIQGAAAINNSDECLLIYASSAGAWCNDISLKITKYVTNPSLVKEVGAFAIQVFKASNLAIPVETSICSRVLGAKDGYGRNIYVEDVLQSSNYIRATNNPLIDSSVGPKDQLSVLAMAAGTDGSAVSDSHMVSALNSFINPNEIPLTIIMDGGWATPAYQTAINVIAQTRQDCVGILSTPYADEISSDYITDLTDYRKTDLNMNSSYCALYTPHLQIQDRFNDRKLWIAPDGHVAGSISFSAANYEIWYPAAGFKRGVISVLDTAQKFTDGELDILADAGINPIKFTSGRGIVIWGQKTLLSRPSALDRLNVRLLLIVIEPAIKSFLEDYLFDLNDEGTRAVIEGKLEGYLETIKARKGITAYDVVCDDTNNSAEDIDANRLNCDIFVKPSRSIEDIPVRVVITPNSISFDTAAGAI